MQHRLHGAAKSIPVGSAKSFPIDGIDLLICNVGGSFYGVEDVCTHDGAPLDQGRLEGNCVVCPRHGATFDVQTGEALTLPAVIPLMTFPITVDGDDLVIEA
jgi:3-phenylpropionate/trans-cinnamate dioxygenase ferredoxin component